MQSAKCLHKSKVNVIIAYSNFVVAFCILALTPCASPVLALGNHPEANTCPKTSPYYAFCTHSLHSLEGWSGECHATAESAQHEADEHARKYHDGNNRWTGVLKARAIITE